MPKHTNSRHLFHLLRVRRDWPSHRETDKSDELAPLHCRSLAPDALNQIVSTFAQQVQAVECLTWVIRVDFGVSEHVRLRGRADRWARCDREGAVAGVTGLVGWAKAHFAPRPPSLIYLHRWW